MTPFPLYFLELRTTPLLLNFGGCDQIMPFRLKDSSQATLKRLADTVVNNMGMKRGGKNPGIFSRRCGETLVVVVVVDVQELGTTQPPIKCDTGCSIMD